MNRMVCPNCGKATEGEKFCSVCGEKLSKNENSAEENPSPKTESATTDTNKPSGKSSKKIFLLAVCVVLLTGIMATGAFFLGKDINTVEEESTTEEQVVIEKANGQFGENIYWTLYSNGNLVITGTGDEYSGSEVDSFDEYRQEVKTADIEYGITAIAYRLFADCGNLTSITIPDSVTYIGSQSFLNCYKLTSIDIPDGVGRIENNAFADCISLTDIVIPASVTDIGEYAFSDCSSLKSITLSDGVTYIGDFAFSNCTGLTEFTLPSSVTQIGVAPFFNCTSICEFKVDENNKNFSNDGCGVLFNKEKTVLIHYPAANKRTNYAIPDGVTDIKNLAFWECENLTNISIPDGVSFIGNSAFENCTALTNITIPAGVTSIEDFLFDCCTALTSVTLPESVNYIGDYAFSDCDSLTTVYYTGSEEQWNETELLVGHEHDLDNFNIVFDYKE